MINSLLLALSKMLFVFVEKFSLWLMVVPKYLYSSALSIAVLLIMIGGGSGSSRWLQNTSSLVFSVLMSRLFCIHQVVMLEISACRYDGDFCERNSKITVSSAYFMMVCVSFTVMSST